jgi:hemerythrin-like domain-containing protein
MSSTAHAADQETAKIICSAPDPIGLLKEEHALQLELCELLEVIVNDLPNEFKPALAVIAVSILQGSVAAHARFEDEALFPVLRSRLAPGDPLLKDLSSLSIEHGGEAAIIAALSQALKSAIETGCVREPEALARDLRQFIALERHHIAWENARVVTAAEAVLTAADMVELQSWIMQSDHPHCCRQTLTALRRARSGKELCQSCPASIRSI